MKPILFSWGPITLYSYGLMMAVGFLMFLAYIRRVAPKLDLDPEKITNTAFVVLIAGIAGGRVLFVLLNLDFYLQHPVDIVLLNRGGLVWYGGFAGGVLATYLCARRQRISVAGTFDIFVPPLALAQAAGRIGCFLNGCCYGFETHSPLGVCFPNGLGCRFPVQLLNAALLLALFLFLHRCLKAARRPGGLFWIYGVGYGLLRFSTEFFRGDQPVVAVGLTIAQLMSVVLILVSAAALLVRRMTQES